MHNHCFPPVIDKDTEIIIFGSFPGPESLRKKQYYGHPQNQFWKLVGNVIGEDLASMTYTQRLQTLHKHHIGIWDVYASCERDGSSDTKIRDAKVNNFSILKRFPRLRLVCFNGKTAERIGKAVDEYCKTAVLPSSSPANTVRFATKLGEWKRTLSKRL